MVNNLPIQKTAFAEINLTESVQNAVLELYTTEGKLVKTILSSTPISKGEAIVPFDINHLSNGVYFIKLKTEKGNAVVKLIKVSE